MVSQSDICDSWGAFVTRYEVIYQNHDGLESAIVAVVLKMATVVPLIILCGMFIVPAMDFIGGVIMVTARYLGNKFVKPLIEKHKAEGKEIGLEEGKEIGLAEADAEWDVWYEGFRAAQEKGEPFDEPPPSSRRKNRVGK